MTVPLRLFSARHGVMGPDRAPAHDEDRHRHEPQEACESDERFRCRCPSLSPTTYRQCCCRATQEDRLCDWCRDGCVTSVGGHLRPLADIYQEVP